MSERKIGKFLRKLFSILDNSQYSSIISWDGFGENIIILDQEKLQSEVIPSHFSLRKISSFIRQLHLYNFHKKKSKKNCLIFYNPCFIREQRDLAIKIIRKRKTKAQMELQSETKASEKTIQVQKQNNDMNQEISLSQFEQKEQQMIKSYQSLEIIQFKSYNNIQLPEQDPYDILNLL